ncbi:hypothetical protein [Virgibacillus saliphilus]|nr:hypothetical protein [Virgibacillus sp. NKC19-3]
MKLDELDLSPVVVKAKVNLMLGKRKGNTARYEPMLTYRNGEV